MRSKPTQQIIRMRNRAGHDGSRYVVRDPSGTWFRFVLDNTQRNILPGEPLHLAVQRHTAALDRQFWPDDSRWWIDPPTPADYTSLSPVRFWIYWRDGVVKITVPFGESVTIGYGGPTDEGWSLYTETFTHDPDDDTITREVVSDGVDCDGRMTHFSESVWKRSGAMAPMFEFADDGEMIELAGILQPDWELAGRCQRDYAAEAAGY